MRGLRKTGLCFVTGFEPAASITAHRKSSPGRSKAPDSSHQYAEKSRSRGKSLAEADREGIKLGDASPPIAGNTWRHRESVGHHGHRRDLPYRQPRAVPDQIRPGSSTMRKDRVVLTISLGRAGKDRRTAAGASA